jgi:hypothetical protein
MAGRPAHEQAVRRLHHQLSGAVDYRQDGQDGWPEVRRSKKKPKESSSMFAVGIGLALTHDCR